MGTDYLPPPIDKIPFNFTEQGYEPAGSTSVLFNFVSQGSFGTLQAAINVMQPYWYTTHTYPKSCPKYVIGYGPGGVQVIRGRCTYGGIRDLRSTIFGYEYTPSGSITASIIGTIHSGQGNLPALLRITQPETLPAAIGGHLPVDLPTSLNSIKFKGTGDLDAFLATHSPRDLSAYAGVHVPVDLPTTVVGEKWHGTGEIGSSIDKHLPRNITAQVATHRPRNLGIILRAWSYKTPTDFPASVHGWQESPDLSASISYHQPQDIRGLIRGWVIGVSRNLPARVRGYTEAGLQASIDTHNYEQIRAEIRSWHRLIEGNLPTVIRIWQPDDITAQIDTHPWQDLRAIVLPHPPPPLRASIRGWVLGVQDNLPSYIRGWQAGDVQAYAGGHPAGNLGIILRAWVYGAHQDIPGFIHGWQQLELPATIKGHQFSNLGIILRSWHIGAVVNLPANIHGWQQLDLGMFTKGGHQPGDVKARIRIFQHVVLDFPGLIHGWRQVDFSSTIAAHLPSDITSNIRGFGKSFSDLVGRTYGYSISDLGLITGGGHLPGNLGGLIKVSAKEYGEIVGIIHGWEWRNLGMTLRDTHDPVDLRVYISPQERKESFLAGHIFGWVAKNLTASLRLMFPADLTASVFVNGPVNLPAYLKARLFGNIKASLHGYSESYLGAIINQVYSSDLYAKVTPLSGNWRNLPVKIYIYGSGVNTLPSFVRGMEHSSLTAILTPKYIANILAYVYPVTPRYLKGVVHGWAERFLQGILTVAAYPWNLTASITPRGTYGNLSASIYKARGTQVSTDLRLLIHGLEVRNLSAYIFADRTGNLSAFIEPYMMGSDLHASIRPKMIRLTTLVKIPTMVARDMSAIINYPCFRTGYSILNSLIWAKYKGDLYAFIRPRITFAEPIDLGAKTGYTDGYLEVDKYKISVIVLPSSYFSEDVFKFKVYALDQSIFLNAYIRATPRFRNFTASIVCDAIKSYSYETTFKNRETVIHKTYAGIFKTFEVVEMSFKSAVKEYFYSGVGNVAWKADPFEKWMLDVRSLLPQDLTLKLKRRLHRMCTVYDFRKFDSVDAAVRYAIAHVTEWPEGNLGATIYNRGYQYHLTASLVPKYTKTAASLMAANIVPLQDTIVIGEADSVSVIRK